MRINRSLLNQIGNVTSIKKYKTCSVINDRFLIFDFNNSSIDIFNDVFDFSIKNVYYDDSYYDAKYKEISDLMDNTFNYYWDLQDKIEEMGYPSKSFYILIINISKIYHLLDIGRYFLDIWYNFKDKIEREIIVVEKNTSLIDVDSSTYDSFIPVLVSLYGNNNLIINDLYRYNLSIYENALFLCLISIVPKIKGDNVDSVIELINYVDTCYSYLLKEYKDNQSNNHEKFKE